MKKNTFLLLWFALFTCACGQNDIALYNEESRLDFLSTETCVFTDKDYLAQTTKGVLTADVQLMGYVLENPLSFCLRIVQDSTNKNIAKIDLLGQYVFEAGQYKMSLKLNVERPREIGVLYSAILLFDDLNPAHEFAKGKVEQQQIKVGVIFNIHPKAWNDYFGIYSNAKYVFMMDHWKLTIDVIPNTTQGKEEIRATYAMYKKLHGPLYDDQTPKQEITFPL